MSSGSIACKEEKYIKTESLKAEPADSEEVPTSYNNLANPYNLPSNTRKRKVVDSKDIIACDQCVYKGSKSALAQHKKYKHDGIRYPCDQCEYTARYISHLKQHVLAKHVGFKYPCDQCEYAATLPSDLKRHKESTHDGIRYPCDFCE